MKPETMEIKVAMVRKNLYIKDLAKYLCITRQTMSRLIQNPDQLTLGQAKKIAAVLGMECALMSRR